MENQIPSSPLSNSQSPVPESSPPSRKPIPNFAVWIAAATATLVIGIGVGLALGKYSQLASSQIYVSAPTLLPAETPVVTPDLNRELTGSAATANWKTYTNTKMGFQIKYPKTIGISAEEWVYEEFELKGALTGYQVGFGTTASKSGGYIWGVSVYDNQNTENLIQQMGSQFSDRVESRKQVSVNGIPALLVTVTTNQIPSWIFKAVYIQRGGKVFYVSNGATDIQEFEKFYNSLKFTN